MNLLDNFDWNINKRYFRILYRKDTVKRCLSCLDNMNHDIEIENYNILINKYNLNEYYSTLLIVGLHTKYINERNEEYISKMYRRSSFLDNKDIKDELIYPLNLVINQKSTSIQIEVISSMTNEKYLIKNKKFISGFVNYLEKFYEREIFNKEYHDKNENFNLSYVKQTVERYNKYQELMRNLKLTKRNKRFYYPKNNQLAILCMNFIKFLNSEQIIFSNHISNDQCRFIFEYFQCLKLIKADIGISNPVQYVRTLIRNEKIKQQRDKFIMQH
jgi:hypothetical protein